MRDFTLRIYDPLAQAESVSAITVNRAGGIELPAFRRDVTEELVEGFPRTIGQYGPDKGVFVLESNDMGEMLDFFDTWLGCHVVEKSGTDFSWEGLIYMIDVIYNGDRDRRALFGVPTHEQLWNRVRALYQDMSVSESDELCANNSFEVAGTGGADVFFDWAETAGGGTIVQSGAAAVSGSNCAQLTEGAFGATTSISQYMTLREGETYKLSFYTQGDGLVAGRYRVYDHTNGAAIVGVTSTGVTAASWTLYEADFIVPSGCQTVSIDLIAPAVGTGSGGVLFDDVSVKVYSMTLLATGWVSNDKSVARYGIKEIEIDVGVTNVTNAESARDIYLTQRAWPWARTVSTAPNTELSDIVRLECYVAGYSYTMNYQYVTELSSKSLSIAAAIDEIITNDCQFIEGINIAASYLADMLNQERVTDGGIRGYRAGAVIFRLAQQGDTSSVVYQFYIDIGRKAVYGPLSLAPKYYRRLGIYSDDIGGDAVPHPRQFWPGVVRRMDHPTTMYESGSFLQDRRDMFIKEFGVDRQGLMIATVDSFADSEITRYADTVRPKDNGAKTSPIGNDGGQETWDVFSLESALADLNFSRIIQ